MKSYKPGSITGKAYKPGSITGKAYKPGSVTGKAYKPGEHPAYLSTPTILITTIAFLIIAVVAIMNWI